MKNTLHLSVSKRDFEVLATGEKGLICLPAVSWIRKLLTKEYMYVCITQGKGQNGPTILAEYKWWASWEGQDCFARYSNGHEMEVNNGDIVVGIGTVITIKNYKEDEKSNKKSIKKRVAMA